MSTASSSCRMMPSRTCCPSTSSTSPFISRGGSSAFLSRRQTNDSQCGIARGRTTPVEGQRRFFGKMRSVRRVLYPWQQELQRDAWAFMHQEMIAHFRSPEREDPTRSLVRLNARLWPKFCSKEMILEEKDRLPGLITRHGPDRGIVLRVPDIMPHAFDEEGGHLSHAFKGKLFRIHIEDTGFDELCYISDVRAHTVDKKLYFLRFDRHVPYKQMSTVDIPVSLLGVYGCPGQLKGSHVELAMPTVKCEIVGEEFPSPFLVDCSRLSNRMDGMDLHYGRITLADIEHLLEPYKGLVRFSRQYTNLEETEVVMCYDVTDVPEQPLPADWKDPNFDNRQGRYHLTYSGFWPKQVQRG
ncbi:unnamed protein product [Amoebophrya sp. A25]|nr:unnamed protein product [Amoebophrya sp. A25]|eukprot:GSA25T00017266001.1